MTRCEPGLLMAVLAFLTVAVSVVAQGQAPPTVLSQELWREAEHELEELSSAPDPRASLERSLQRTKERIRRAGLGLGFSGTVAVSSVPIAVFGAVNCAFECNAKGRVLRGVAFAAAPIGVVGTFVSGVFLSDAKRKKLGLERRLQAELQIGPGVAGLRVRF